MRIPSTIMDRKHSFFAGLLVLATLLIYAGIHTAVDLKYRFDGGGYSYAYYGGQSSFATFVDARPFNEAQMQEVAGYLAQANLQPTDSTEQKIIKLATLVLRRLDDTRGIPDQGWEKNSKYEQFRMVWDKKMSGIWCSHFRLVYTHLANLAGIPTRAVHSGVARSPWANEEKKVGASRHTFSESYIAEKDQWAFVDVDQKIILMRDSNGNYLNAVDLHDIMMGYRRDGNLQVATYDSARGIVRDEAFETTEDLADFLREQTAHEIFIQANQKFWYNRNGRLRFLYRPYVGTLVLGKKLYVLGGLGLLMGLVSCGYFGNVLFGKLRRSRTQPGYDVARNSGANKGFVVSVDSSRI